MTFHFTYKGPLIAMLKGRHTVVGVASFAAKPCHSNVSKPGGFARVTAQLDWILDNSNAGRCYAKRISKLSTQSIF